LAEPRIKGRLESPELTTNQTGAVRKRLNECLASDPFHITPGQKGDHVRAIQDALEAIRKRYTDLGLPEIDDTPGDYGSGTIAAVLYYKRRFDIRRTGQPLDDIVGRMTISKIDDDLLYGPKPGPSPPVPPPAPAPPTILGFGGVHIGPVGDKAWIIDRYYNNCGQETIGLWARIMTSSPARHFRTFEELIDHLLVAPELQQVVVNHGDPNSGLLVPFAKETGFRDTGAIIDMFAVLAEQEATGFPDPAVTKFSLAQATRTLRVHEQVVWRIVHKLVLLRMRKLVLHFRACHLTDDNNMMQEYGKALGTSLITYHSCRLLFLQFHPVQNRIHSDQDLRSLPGKSNAKRRYRVFDYPYGFASTLVIGVEDIDGHTAVGDDSVLENWSPEDVQAWAVYLLGQWRQDQDKPNEFVMPVMWDNVAEGGKYTFYCPKEAGWSGKLQVVGWQGA
jgi:hypothetical protein